MKATAIAAIVLLAGTAAAQAIPDMKPGDSCEKLRASYGNESSQEGPAHVWKQGAVEIRVLVKPNGPCVAGLVEYSIQPGHTFRTRDGIILGKDTVAEANQKLRGRIDANSYMALRGEGKAYGQLVVAPSAAFPFTGTYSWQLSPAAANKLSGPPRLADFTNEPVTVYSIDSENHQ
jgi:hypothetical protein